MLSVPTSENLSDTFTTCPKVTQIDATGVCTSTWASSDGVVTESWKVHEDREYRVHHEFERVADNSRCECEFGCVTPITSL